MAFGVLESISNPSPKGTTLLENLHGDRGAQVILVPQPSTSPADPLNMPRLRKELAFATIIFGACATGVIGPLLVPGFSIIATSFEITITQVTLLNGSLVMALGVSSYLCSCLASIYGKRLIYIFTTLLLVVTCCWGASAKTYNSLLAARVMQGFGMGGFFALAGTASLNDIFFVHERGFRVGLWNFAIIVSVNMTPIVSGYVIVDLSWRWSFWLLAITFGVLLALVLLFFPETTFDRGSITTSSVASIEVTDAKAPLDDESVLEDGSETVSYTSPFWRRALGLENLKIRDQSRLFQLCVTPFALLRHPAVIWGCMMWAVTFTWVIIQGAVAIQIFGAPPYNLSPSSVGNLVGIAPLIGAALGTFFGGWACDAISRTLAMRNNGIYEPEFRLLVIIPALIAMVIGGFGLGAAVHEGLSSVTCGVFLGFINFAVGVGCTGIVAYTNDVCEHKAGEAFGIAMLIKSAFAFGLTFMLNDYYAANGPRVFFFTWTGLTVGVMMLTVPLYVYGKRIRAWAEVTNVL